MKRTIRLLFLFILAVPAAKAQLSAYTGWAVSPQSSGGTPVFVVLAPIQYGQVRVCTTPASNSPCTPIASIFDANGNPLSVSGGNFGQVITDVTGKFSFQCNPGNFTIQVAASGSNTPQLQYLTTCPATQGALGGAGLGTANVFTNTNTFNSNVTALAGANQINAGKLNGVCVLDGVLNTTLAAAVSCAGASSSSVFIPPGVTTPTAQIASSTALEICGAGIGQTVIRPTGALAATLFSLTGSTESYKFCDLTIDMTNAGSQNVFDVNGPVRPRFDNISVIYPAGSSGKGLNFINSGSPRVVDYTQKFGGYCIDYNGDNASEAHFILLDCQSQTTRGVRITRTTTTDIGGFYFTQARVTNPGNQATNQSWEITSSIANSITPFFCSVCVGDNALGGPAFLATNVNLLQIGGTSWFTTGTGNAAGAVTINGVVDFSYTGGHIQSSATGTDFVFQGTDTSINLSNIQFRGSNKSIGAVGATLAGYLESNLSFNVNPALADETVLAGAAGNAAYRYGTTIGTRNDLGNAQTFSLANKTAAGVAPTKHFRVNQTGGYEILNDSGSTVISTLSDTGSLNITGITNATGLQVFTAAPGAGTCPTAAAVGATCTTAAITLPVAYADTNYRLSCTVLGIVNFPIVETYTKSNTTFTITIAALTAAAANFGSFDCTAGHN